MRSFEEILSELGKALDAALGGSIKAECSPAPVVPAPVVPAPVVTNPSGDQLFTAEPTKTAQMKEIVKLGVTANGGQYRVIVFDDGKMRVYQSVQKGWKQVSDNSSDTPKSAMYAYLAGPFMQPRINDFLWNVIDAKLFAEEIK